MGQCETVHFFTLWSYAFEIIARFQPGSRCLGLESRGGLAPDLGNRFALIIPDIMQHQGTAHAIGQGMDRLAQQLSASENRIDYQNIPAINADRNIYG